MIQIDNVFWIYERLLQKLGLSVAHEANAPLSKPVCWDDKGDRLGCRVDIKEKTIGPKFMELNDEHSELMWRTRERDLVVHSLHFGMAGPTLRSDTFRSQSLDPQVD